MKGRVRVCTRISQPIDLPNLLVPYLSWFASTPLLNPARSLQGPLIRIKHRLHPSLFGMHSYYVVQSYQLNAACARLFAVHVVSLSRPHPSVLSSVYVTPRREPRLVRQ